MAAQSSPRPIADRETFLNAGKNEASSPATGKARFADNPPGTDVNVAGMTHKRFYGLNCCALIQCSLAGLLWGALSNSSPIHFWKAVMFCGRPRKFFTRSFADIDPPGSNTSLL
jgi:hypothetical protein